MTENTQSKQRWFEDGFGLSVFELLLVRMPQAWRGLVQVGGISTGHWRISPFLEDRKYAARVRRILELYGTREDFLEDHEP